MGGLVCGAASQGWCCFRGLLLLRACGGCFGGGFGGLVGFVIVIGLGWFW